MCFCAISRVLLLTTLAGTALSTCTIFSADTPNIVFILADDLGIGDLKSCNPETKIRTPNMDKLASEGLRFTDMHTPSAVCTPTRYGLMTGRYCWRSSLKKGVLNGYSPALIEPDRMTLPKMLKTRGYTTACIGKWHLGLGSKGKTDYSKPLDAGPLTAGFDYFFGIPASLDMEPYVWIKNDRVEKEPTETVVAGKHQREGGEGFWRGGPVAPGFKHVDVLPRLVSATQEYLNEKRDKPFFLYLPLTSPHTPWLPTPEFVGKSAVGAYGDFTEQTDAAVESILETLEKNGLKENTIVVLTSDNGSHWPEGDIQKWNHRANHIYRGQKADIHEGGHRVPFIVRWPGKIAAGGSTKVPACLTDMFVTFAALVNCEVSNNAGEDSFNLLPVWLSPKAFSDETVINFEAFGDLRLPPASITPLIRPIIHHSADGLFAIRVGDWKLAEGLGSGGFTAPKTIKPKDGEPIGQLYNLKDDPSEKTNLYAEKPEIVKDLLQRLNAIRDNGRSRP